jgi:hypothetical protein
MVIIEIGPVGFGESSVRGRKIVFGLDVRKMLVVWRAGQVSLGQPDSMIGRRRILATVWLADRLARRALQR